MSQRTAGVLAWSVCAVAAALVIATLPLIVASRDSPMASFYGTPLMEAVFLVLMVAALPAVGALVASRRPDNPVGWILLVCGVMFAFSSFANDWAKYALLTAPGALPGGAFVAWSSSTWSWIPAFGLLDALFLIFPTGRLQSARWRPVLVVLIFATGLLLVGYSLRPGPFDPPWTSLVNPYAPNGVLGDAMTVLATAGNWSVAVLFAVGAVGLALRFRRARGVERQQLKWFAYSGALLAAFIPLAYWLILFEQVPDVFVPLSLIGLVIFASVPLSVGAAILRYRLYDIDLLINRTAVYGATSLGVGATFFVGIVALQPLLRPLTSGSEIAIAASTLVSFALFQPLRRRIQSAIDRRFDRSRYDAALTLDAFADRLRDVVDLDELSSDLVGAVRQTMSPAHASIWLRDQ